MATIHNVLAKVQSEGVAKIFYGHPVIQKTSLILNNRKVITSPKGDIVKIAIKMMPSGKRILLNSRTVTYDSIQQFIEEVGEEQMVKAAAREVSSGFPHIENFDGDQDKSYLITKHVLPRFNNDEDYTERIDQTEEIDSGDGFVTYGNLVVQEFVLRSLKASASIASENTASNVLLVGPSGNGKTSLAMAFAEENGLSFTKVNCSVIRDPEEWFGYREAKEGSTIFVETEFTRKVKEGNAVILLDEINRLESYLHNSLIPLLDETRETTIHGNNIQVGENVIFFCTMNLGAGFVGTFLLDNAVKNRMDMTIVMGKLPVEREIQLLVKRTGVAESVARKIVNMLEKIRESVIRNEIDIDVSHRSALKIARTVKTSFLDVREAITLIIFNNAENPEQAKMLTDSLIGA